MKKLLIILSFISTCILSSATYANQTPKLDPHLTTLTKFLGTWESTFSMATDKPSVIDVATWERALNGKAIRTLHSINDGEYGGESLIFWDTAQQKIVFYYFTTANFFTNGYIEIIDDYNFVAYEAVSGSDQGITEVKSTSTFIDNTITITTSYLKKGQWSTPDSRVYKASVKTVKFK